MASSSKAQKSGGEPQRLTPKHIAIIVLTALVLGFMAYQIADYLGVINNPKPSTDPAVVDPTSTYTPEMKEQQKKIEEQRAIEEAKPNPVPPSGS